MAHFKTHHFNLISQAINLASDMPDNDIETLNQLVDIFVLQFAMDNSLFKESMFRRGCGEKISQCSIILPVVANEE